MNTRFLILNLPQDAVLKVLKSMELYQVIAFSLISNRSLSLAKLLNFNGIDYICLQILHNPTIFVRLSNGSFCYFKICGHFVTTTFTDSNHCRGWMIGSKLAGDWKNGEKKHPEYKEPQKWIHHIFGVLNQPSISKLTFEGAHSWEYYDMVFDAIQECEEVIVRLADPSHSQIRHKVVEVYTKKAKEATIDGIRLKSSNVFYNLDYLDIANSWFFENRRVGLDLDSLLTINTTYLKALCPCFKILNQFLKLWSRKKTNPRLRYARFPLNNREFKIEEILAGIRYHEEAGIRKFNYPKEDNEKGWEKADRKIQDFKGGFDFKRCDGTLGTIIWNKAFSRIEFFVWN